MTRAKKRFEVRKVAQSTWWIVDRTRGPDPIEAHRTREWARRRAAELEWKEARSS